MTEELKNIQLAVQQKLGRNMILFQHLEKQLKLITPFMDIKGVALSMESMEKVQDTKNNKNTLGALFNKFSNSLKINTEETLDSDVTEATMYATIKLPAEVQEEWITKLQALLYSRNEIVHQFIDLYKMNSIDDLTEAEKYLDKQRENVISGLNSFENVTKAFGEIAAKSGEIMDSVSVVRQFVDLSGWQVEYTIPDED